ncbi:MULTISPECIES: PaREP1 family protein [unclassified Lysinibacillus]|uniref:PaREP1 family protein n=1 Tax=unclassified Lysinibacillus TaxID=2636778 RepID=UPI0020116430|nr:MULTISPECIES: PaREP1 family protein [unclassified Lysinibacillus]MCL1698069.1 PaREP1 family protein [Lysinibacillus sp. BPa_S21]MCL1702781.1 PaREP1 family protein [Lysinibacillus sp. Bpr_S20]
MDTKELRNAIAETCENYDSLYAQLVKPINQILINVDASIGEDTANKIIENLKLFHSGDKNITECHLDESENFLKEGIELLKKGDLANGALQIYGAGLNFASYTSKIRGQKNVNPYKNFEKNFSLIMNSLKK